MGKTNGPVRKARRRLSKGRKRGSAKERRGAERRTMTQKARGRKEERMSEISSGWTDESGQLLWKCADL